MSELDLKRTQLLWETTKLSEAEAKLHHSQQEHAKLRKDQTKLHMRNQDTLDQLEQGRYYIINIVTYPDGRSWAHKDKIL